MPNKDDDKGWLPLSTPPQPTWPQPDAQPDRPITVMGLVDDPAFRHGEEAYPDVVSYWPAQGRWTITHCCRADGEATDHPVKLRAWQPMVEVPPPWSDLWKGPAS